MLERLLNKRIKVKVALYSDSMPRALFTTTFEGMMVAYDDNFIVFEDDSMINIKYIQTIEVK
jgi:hypothetical protein